MKRIYFLLAVLTSTITAYSQGEWVSASIGNGSTPNSASLFIRSAIEFDANKCDNIVFTLRVPVSAGPNVVVSESYHDASISHISFAIQKLNVDDGSYYYYLVNGTGTVLGPTGTVYAINTPIKLLELSFAGGATNGIVQLANIENDIPGNIFLRPQFYIQINTGDITNYGTMFYGTGSAVPVNNQAVTGDDFVGTPAAVALPIKFLSFNAVKKDNNAALSWTVENESALTDRYEIERSINGRDFEKIKTVSALNNGNSNNIYSAEDQRVDALKAMGRVYYKIRQIDRDGRFVYSETKSISLSGKNFEISVYPNPVVSIGNLNIDLPEAGKVNIVLLDASGKELQHALLNGIVGLNVYSLNMSKLASGTYVLKVIAGTETISLPVVKKK